MKNVCGLNYIYFGYYSSWCFVDIPECANNRAQCFSLPPAAKLL